MQGIFVDYSGIANATRMMIPPRAINPHNKSQDDATLRTITRVLVHFRLFKVAASGNLNNLKIR